MDRKRLLIYSGSGILVIGSVIFGFRALNGKSPETFSDNNLANPASTMYFGIETEKVSAQETVIVANTNIALANSTITVAEADQEMLERFLPTPTVTVVQTPSPTRAPTFTTTPSPSQ